MNFDLSWLAICTTLFLGRRIAAGSCGFGSVLGSGEERTTVLLWKYWVARLQAWWESLLNTLWTSQEFSRSSLLRNCHPYDTLSCIFLDWYLFCLRTFSSLLCFMKKGQNIFFNTYNVCVHWLTKTLLKLVDLFSSFCYMKRNWQAKCPGDLQPMMEHRECRLEPKRACHSFWLFAFTVLQACSSETGGRSKDLGYVFSFCIVFQKYKSPVANLCG